MGGVRGTLRPRLLDQWQRCPHRCWTHHSDRVPTGSAQLSPAQPAQPSPGSTRGSVATATTVCSTSSHHRTAQYLSYVSTGQQTTGPQFRYSASLHQSASPSVRQSYCSPNCLTPLCLRAYYAPVSRCSPRQASCTNHHRAAQQSKFPSSLLSTAPARGALISPVELPPPYPLSTPLSFPLSLSLTLVPVALLAGSTLPNRHCPWSQGRPIIYSARGDCHLELSCHSNQLVPVPVQSSPVQSSPVQSSPVRLRNSASFLFCCRAASPRRLATASFSLRPAANNPRGKHTSNKQASQ